MKPTQLKEKYIRISNLFSMGFFLSYVHKMDITDKNELELFNFIKQHKEASPSHFFDTVFEHIEQSKKRQYYMRFMLRVWEEMLHIAKHQLEFVMKEITELEQKADARQIMADRYEKLTHGYYCPVEEIDEMLEHYTKDEEFEKCSALIHIKKKYYGG